MYNLSDKHYRHNNVEYLAKHMVLLTKWSCNPTKIAIQNDLNVSKSMFWRMH